MFIKKYKNNVNMNIIQVLCYHQILNSIPSPYPNNILRVTKTIPYIVSLYYVHLSFHYSL